MATLTYTNTFADGDSINLGSKIQTNFNEARDFINGNIDGGNIKSSSDFNIHSLVASTSINVKEIKNKTLSDVIFTLNTFAGKKLRIVDSGDSVLFELDENKNVTM